MKALKRSVVRALVFCRIIDEHDGNLSLTNIALLVILMKFVGGTLFTKDFNLKIEDVVGVGVALAAYQAKKAINRPRRRTRKRVEPEL